MCTGVTVKRNDGAVQPKFWDYWNGDENRSAANRRASTAWKGVSHRCQYLQLLC
jgi:hypothetical protein